MICMLGSLHATHSIQSSTDWATCVAYREPGTHDRADRPNLLSLLRIHVVLLNPHPDAGDRGCEQRERQIHEQGTVETTPQKRNLGPLIQQQ